MKMARTRGSCQRRLKKLVDAVYMGEIGPTLGRARHCISALHTVID
jgi:hypothetical protein